LERALDGELDFLSEAQSAQKAHLDVAVLVVDLGKISGVMENTIK